MFKLFKLCRSSPKLVLHRQFSSKVVIHTSELEKGKELWKGRIKTWNGDKRGKKTVLKCAECCSKNHFHMDSTGLATLKDSEHDEIFKDHESLLKHCEKKVWSLDPTLLIPLSALLPLPSFLFCSTALLPLPSFLFCSIGRRLLKMMSRYATAADSVPPISKS